MKRFFLALAVLMTAIFTVQAQSKTLDDVSFFVNNEKLECRLYKNDLTPPVSGANYSSAFVEVETIFSYFGFKVEETKNCVRVSVASGQGGLEIVTNPGSYVQSPGYGVLNLKDKYFYKIEGKYWISIAMVRYIIDGSLKEDEKSVYLFTKDYNRTDIPATLEDCYKALDQVLDDDFKDAIKKSENVIEFHRDLGTWMRNEWIYPAPDRVAKLFLDKNIRHPDDISYYIILGYHYYLMGKEVSLDELIKK